MVGHVPVDLRNSRTLGAVYLDPILRILQKRNAGRQPGDGWAGLLEDDPTADVQLVIDFVRPISGLHRYKLTHRNPTGQPCGRSCSKLSDRCWKRDT